MAGRQLSSKGNHLLCGVELPTPISGYPTLDILGSATSTVSNANYNPSSIAEALRQRLTIELGISISESYLLEPINRLIENQGTAVSTPEGLSQEGVGEEATGAKNQDASTGQRASQQGGAAEDSVDDELTKALNEQMHISKTVKTKHFVDRTSQNDRPSDTEAMRVVASPTAVERSVETSDQSRRVIKAEKGNIVIYDVRKLPDGTERWVLITTMKKLRQQLVLILEGDLADRVMAYRQQLQSTQRSSYARRRGSGVSDVVALSAENIRSTLEHGATDTSASASWRSWSDNIVDTEVKNYSVANTGISDCSINPDFVELYYPIFKESLITVLESGSNFMEQVANAIPTLFWGGTTPIKPKKGGAGIDVVFLTVGIPASAHVKVVKDQDGKDIVSIAPNASSHGPVFYEAPSPAPAPPVVRPKLAEVVCQQCRETFSYDSVFFKKKGFPPPKRCKLCRSTKNKNINKGSSSNGKW